MKKTLLAIGVIAVLALSLFVLTGCGAEEKGLIGSWKYTSGSSEYIYTFNEDGTGSYSYFGTERPFTYEDNETSVTITYDGDTTGGTYEYEIEGNTLKIKDSFGSTVEYSK